MAVNLGPGETLAVTGDCTDACNGATSVVATVTVGSWPTDIGPIFATASAAYSLRAMPRLVTASATSVATLTPSASLVLGSCGGGVRGLPKTSAGAILGGGSEQFVWQVGIDAFRQRPVVLNAAPSSCALGASTGW